MDLPFEIVDFTTATSLEALAIEFEKFLRSKASSSTLNFEGSLVKIEKNPKYSEWIKNCTRWKDYYLISCEESSKRCSVTSAFQIALQKQDLKYLIKSTNKAAEESYFGSDNLSIQVFPFIPNTALDLAGVMEIYRRNASRPNSDIFSSISASYKIVVNDVELKVKCIFRKRIYSHYLGISIDPMMCDEYVVSASLFDVRHPWTDMLSFCFEHTKKDNVSKAGVDNFIPGGYEGGFYIDPRWTEAKIRDIFSPESRPPTRHMEDLIASLRFQNCTIPFDSLLWRFCVALLKNSSVPHFDKVMSNLWSHILREIRLYVENGILLPAIDGSKIPHNHILIHQKICMINASILREKENQNLKFEEKANSIFKSSNGNEVYEPITQRPKLMTSDQILEEQEILKSLGTSSEGKQIRERRQCAELVSDMESFKFANNSAEFIDFVRWHSPKDVCEVNGTWKLSSRFSSQNLWLDLWQSVQPNPAHLQKPLHDSEKQVAMALNYLESVSIGELLQQLLPAFVLVTLDSIPSLENHPNLNNVLDFFSRKIPDISFHAIKFELQAIEETLKIASVVESALDDEQMSKELAQLRETARRTQLPIELKKLLLDVKGEILAPCAKEYWLSSPYEIAKSDREDAELLDDLRDHVQSLNHSNSQLRTKMQFFKTLYDAETKKKSPYMHITPRVESGISRKNVSTDYVKMNRSVQKISSNSDEMKKMAETINELSAFYNLRQDVNSQYRTKLTSQDDLIEKIQQEKNNLEAQMEQLVKNSDVDRLSFQHEISELKKKYFDQRAKFDSLEDHHRQMTKSHREISVTVEALGKDLADERLKNSEFENERDKWKLIENSEKQYRTIISDLEAEKGLLQSELEKMMESRFGAQKDEEYQEEIGKLKGNIFSLESENSQLKEENAQNKETILDLEVMLSSSKSISQNAEAKALELQHQLELSQALSGGKFQNDKYSEEDMEEAFALLRLKREAGMDFDFLYNWKQIEMVLRSKLQDQQSVQELRRQYAECVQTLEKTTVMLDLEHQISDELKIEIEKLNTRIRKIQNEYELRIEDYSRLNDIRKHKIESLEQQLRALGQVEIPNNIKYGSIELKGGENIFNISITGAIFNSSCCNYLAKLNPDFSSFSSLVTFVVIDFYDFETAISAIGLGDKPLYKYQSKFSVTVDDFFLNVLQAERLVLRVYYSNGMEFFPLGYCDGNLSQLLSSDSTPVTFQGNIVSYDNNEIFGSMEYSVQVELPMPLAMKAYKERILRLALTSPLEKEPSSDGTMNSLNVEIHSVQIEKKAYHPSKPTPFCVVNFEHTQTSVLSQSMHGNNPSFGFSTLFAVKTTSELDRHLRTGKLVVTVADDGTSEIIYGYSKIPLFNLALGEKIDGVFDLETAKGVPCGTINVTLYWSQPYVDNPLKSVSIFDEKGIQDEFEGKVAVLGSLTSQTESRQLQAVADENMLKTTANSDLNKNIDSKSLPIDPASLLMKLKILKARLFLNQPETNTKLADVKQVFIGLELFNLPGEMLETPSLLLQPEIDINFDVDISYDNILTLSKQNALAVCNNWNAEKLLISLVDEPPADSTKSECKDIGLGMLDICKLEDGLVQIISITDRDTKETIGQVEIEVKGVSSFYSYCKEIMTRVKE